MYNLLLLILLSLTTVSGTFPSKNPGAEPKRTPPNILFIFADDQRADALGVAGNPYIQTPNLDALAGNGIRFTNCYVMGGHHGAICAPSRAMLMSGKSLFQVYDVLDGVTTMPQHFAKHGYATFGTGKWHNGAKSFEASFQQGKNVFLGGMSDHFKVPCRDLGAEGKLGKPTEKGFSTEVFTDAAIGFIRDHSINKPTQPFFCYVAYTSPHDPRSPDQKFLSMYPDGTIPVPGNFMKMHPFDFGDLKVRDEHLTRWPRTPELIQSSLSDYYALISQMDENIGELIATLKESGLYENTLIVFAADNGLAIGSHGLLGKQNLYEHSMKVPLLIQGPEIPKNQTSDAFVYLYDLFPTLAELAGIPAPDNINGKSLAVIISRRVVP